MSVIPSIFISILLVSAISLAGVTLLSLHEAFLKRILLWLVSFSTGALLGNVFLHLLPEMVESSADVHRSLLLVLAGMLLSFIVEKFIHWRHCHAIHCDSHVHPVGIMMLIGDGAHNVLDGILIASTYLVDPALGVATTIAIILHEIPQEIGDFGILLHSGYSRGRALFLNFASALTAFLGAAFVLALRTRVEGIELILLPITAGNFLYIAGSDLIPELHKESRVRDALSQLLCMLLGIALLWTVSGEGHGHAHDGVLEEDVHYEEQGHDHAHGEIRVFSGVIAPMERPAPDIEYDYKLLLDEPYHDPLDAYGRESTPEFPLISEEGDIDFKEHLGERVSVVGVLEWGYAESRVIGVMLLRE
ncbi:ZIP family metal transporter [Candidatus Peregrinibacteria bacterium]|nr:ZIP family metal transporter [Candidatus Peregrinibacteria bacterium]